MNRLIVRAAPGAGLLLLAALAGALTAQTDAGAKPSLRAQQQPLFARLQVAEAWKITRGDPKVVIGVIDNGFDFFHPDLKGQLTPGYYYPGGYHGEFYENMAHGTLVASLMVARSQDPDGMSGLAPGCRVLTASQGMIEHALLKLQSAYFRAHPQATMQEYQKELLKHAPALSAWATRWVDYQIDGAADAIRYLVDHGVRVINVSGALKRSLCPSAAKWQNLEDAFAHAARKGVIIVLGAGNNAARWEDYPGSTATVIVAGAVRLDDTRWEEETVVRGLKVKQGSNYGKRLTVMAPVENLVVCVPHERRMYATDDGPLGATRVEFKGSHDVLRIGATSSAAPIVTALVALIYSVRPDLEARAVVEIVKQGCDDIGAKGPDLHTGHGRVNFLRSLQLAQGWGK